MRRVRSALLALALIGLASPSPAGFLPPPVPQAPWTAYTPTVSAASGTITTASGSGRYQVIGKHLDIAITATITTNGTGAGYVTATLPAGLTNNASLYCIMAGREDGVTGKMIQAYLAASGTQFAMQFYDGSYPGANSAIIRVTGTCEIQ